MKKEYPTAQKKYTLGSFDTLFSLIFHLFLDLGYEYFACMDGSIGVQKRVSDSLDPELGLVWGTTWALGTKPGSSVRTADALHCQATVSPAPPKWIFSFFSLRTLFLLFLC